MESKTWCFTWNNYPDDYDIVLEKLKKNYLITGFEIGESGTKHIQGYVEFGTNHKLDRLKKIEKSIHWETRKGTGVQARDYCMKDGNFKEFGEIKTPKQGQRNDISKVREMVKTGKGMKDIVNEVDSFQAIRYGELALKYNENKRDWKPEVKWYWGPTGAGKTRQAMDEAKDPYVSGKNLKWWEGYDAHEDVIIDDFRKDFCTFHEFLRILDRYEYRIEVKGASRQLLAKRIWVTSCFPPEKVYETREDVGQLLRRIDFVVEMRLEMEVRGNTVPEPYQEL